MHRVDLNGGAVLEKGCVYVVPLMERLALPKPGVQAVANAKSSTGRLDLLTRTICDGGTEFDRIPERIRRPALCRNLPALVFGAGASRHAVEPDPVSAKASRC